MRTWPSLVGHVHLSKRLLGEVLLAVLLTVSLAFSWRDGMPTDGYVDTSGPLPAGIAALQVSADSLSGRPGHVSPTDIAPSTPDAQSVGPTAPPVQILIPALDVHRAVEKIGVSQSGVLDLPVNAWNAGWFEYGPVPGASGDAVIEGHSGYPGKPLIFGKLVMLQPGDRIIVVLSDRSRQLFIVVSKSAVPVGSYPAGLADPYGPPRLTLVTCTGYFNKQNYTSSERLLVEARYAGVA